MLAQVAQTDWMLVLTVVIAIATVVYSAVTIWMVWEMRATRLAQTSPCVVVYLELREGKGHIFDLIIENIGGGLALEVIFDLPEEMKVRGFSLKGGQLEPLTGCPLVDGLAGIAPRQRVSVVWGLGTVLWPRFDGKRFEVTARYRDAAAKRKFKTSSLVSINSVDSQTLGKEAFLEALEEIKKPLVECSRELRGIKQVVAESRTETTGREDVPIP